MKSPGHRRVSLISSLECNNTNLNSPLNTPNKTPSATNTPTNRRVSLAPAAGTFIKDKRSSLNSNDGTPSKLRKMSQFFHVDKISETLLKDSEKEAFITLHTEHEEVLNEYKRLKSYVEELKEDYEHSRGYEAMTRYNRLKIMIKRTIVHLKVSNVTESSNAVKMRELTKKFEDRYESLSTEQVEHEKVELRENISEYQVRIDTITRSIQDLEEHYNDAKQVFLWTRYQMMKAMVKDIINKPTIVDII